MRLEELDFEIPAGMIAQRPVEPRDSCRLMVLDAGGERHHRRFIDLPGLLRPVDTLVLNDSKVVPARLEGRKPTGGRVELLFLRQEDGESEAEGAPTSNGQNGHHRRRLVGGAAVVSETWEVLARPSRRLCEGMVLVLPGGGQVTLRERLDDSRWLVESASGHSVSALMTCYGKLPLPPYIKEYPDDPSTYQTVYAARPGSAAAPTAGLHFTANLLERLRLSGVRLVFITLHVGLDTFQPIRERVVEEHRIHREAFSVSASSIAALREARLAGGRVIAVGTTAARVLETLAIRGGLDPGAKSGAVRGSADVFITPGYRFRAVDALLTNFHLPRSTVLALVMAFAGIERVRRAYSEAIDLGYRFFSFGDAMLVEAPFSDEAGRRLGE